MNEIPSSALRPARRLDKDATFFALGGMPYGIRPGRGRRRTEAGADLPAGGKGFPRGLHDPEPSTPARTSAERSTLDLARTEDAHSDGGSRFGPPHGARRSPVRRAELPPAGVCEIAGEMRLSGAEKEA